MKAANQRGFTLIEVIVALAIVVLSIGALLGAVTSSASNTDYLRDRTFAEWVALNKLTDTRLGANVPARGETTGEIEYAGRRYAWRQTVTPLPFEGMFKIDVSSRLIKATGPSSDTQDKNGSWTATVTGVMGTSVQVVTTPLGPSWGSLQPANAPTGSAGGNNPGDRGQTPGPLPPPPGSVPPTT
ncbi:MAG: type II secretion system minor pseudopilin GspI [Pseudomonadales bacterium]|jgi:general secretion pathway protein I|nr:type II secretion system minor pseudopilin GspI [Pseudomonadales bacterium]